MTHTVAAVGSVVSNRGRRRVGVGVLRPRRRRHGRRQQELDQDHRPGNRPLRAGLLRLRLEEVGRDHRSRTCARASGRSGRRIWSTAPSFVACHQFEFVDKIDVLEHAAPGAVFLLNAPFPADEVWDHLPREMQEQIIEKQIRFFAIDAYDLAKRAGMGGRINTIMQTCFFAISGVLPRDEAIAHDQEGDREDLRQARAGGRAAQLRGGRSDARAPARDHGARPRSPRRTAVRRWCRSGRPTSCRR